MELLALAPQERVVRRIANQSMLEAINGVRWRASREDQLGVHQLGERILQPDLRELRHGGQKLEGKFAADGAADLHHLPDAGQAVETGHQGNLQRARAKARRYLPDAVD